MSENRIGYWGPNIRIDGRVPYKRVASKTKQGSEQFTFVPADQADLTMGDQLIKPGFFRDAVTSILRQIENTTVIGKALLLGMQEVPGKMLTIVPAPMWGHNKTWTTVLEPPALINLKILYNPYTWIGPHIRMGMDPTFRGYGPADVLFHELIHAFRIMNRIIISGTGGIEHFIAIMFRNIFTSECNTKPGDWPSRPLENYKPGEKAFQQLPEVVGPITTQDQVFYYTFIEPIRMFMGEITPPPWTNFLETVRTIPSAKAPFNPIRVHREKTAPPPEFVVK